MICEFLSAITSVVYLFLTGLVRRDEKEGAMNLPWQLLQYLHFHHQKQLTLEELANEFHLAPSDVTSLLKELTHLSFAQNLTRVRIINATALLEFNALSVNQIGRIVGFQSDAYFYREFKKFINGLPKLTEIYFSRGMVTGWPMIVMTSIGIFMKIIDIL